MTQIAVIGLPFSGESEIVPSLAAATERLKKQKGDRREKLPNFALWI